MPFYRPSVSEIRKRRIADYEYALGSQSPRLPGTVEHGLATSGSGAAHGLHGHIDDVAKNAFPHLADDEELRQWAGVFGVYQLEANRATGAGLFSPSLNIDTLLPAGTIVVRGDGAEYEVTTDTTIIGGNVVTAAPLRARIAGAAGDLAAGSNLTLQAPLPGIQSGATVGVDIQGGLDAESTPSLRARLLARMASPPSGGGPGDYASWAKLTPGVTRAWELKWAPKVGYVTVLFMRDLDNDPFPLPDQITAVRKVILEHAPIIAPAPIVIGPDKYTLALNIALTIESGYDLATVKAAIYANIRKMLLTRTAPQALNWNLYRSWITEAISSTPGELNSELISPAADVPILARALPVLDDGGITWS